LHQSALSIQTIVGQAPFISLLFLSFLKCNIFVKLHLFYSSNLKITMSIYPFISPLCVPFSYEIFISLPAKFPIAAFHKGGAILENIPNKSKNSNPPLQPGTKFHSCFVNLFHHMKLQPSFTSSTSLFQLGIVNAFLYLLSLSLSIFTLIPSLQNAFQLNFLSLAF
jgi:hypothetical protein